MKKILVTGSHRSGTTWLGKILCSDKRNAYIWEPFNKDERISCLNFEFDHWFQYEKQNNHLLATRINDLISLNYPLASNLLRSRSIKDFGKSIIRSCQYRKMKQSSKNIVFKDPIALFSTNWLVKNFGFKAIILIRHPAAFISSLKWLGWRFNFDDFLLQTKLMEDYLYDHEEQIIEVKGNSDIVSQGIVLWNCFHDFISKLKEEKNECIHFYKHEDLSLNPESEIPKVFSDIGLAYDQKIHEYIVKTSVEVNSIKQKKGNETKLNSKSLIKKWKTILTHSEIEKIKLHTKEISSKFYDEDSWS